MQCFVDEGAVDDKFSGPVAASELAEEIIWVGLGVVRVFEKGGVEGDRLGEDGRGKVLYPLFELEVEFVD
jgi:hypothetical protein